MNTKDSPFHLTVELEQHTPIIHFQHYQDGATLRATELKPKLDKYLIEYFEKENIDWTQWQIGDTKALDYRVHIKNLGRVWKDWLEKPKYKNNKLDQKPIGDGKFKTNTYTYPSFFGNMGRDYNMTKEIKKNIWQERLLVKIRSLHHSLMKHLKNQNGGASNLVSKFFLITNFGTRSNRGFGSYSVKGLARKEDYFDYVFEVSIPHYRESNRDYFEELFRNIDLFARVLRAGVNLKTGRPPNQKDVLYIKSFLFAYFKDPPRPVQWEKKAIKEKFLRSALESDKAKRKNSDALHFSSENVFLVRDLLGLATEETWYSYRKTFEKVEARKEGDRYKEKNEKKRLDRAPSPILFKPIEIQRNKFKVYILLKEESLITGRHFVIKEKGSRSDWGLSTPDFFSIKNFFDYVMKNKKSHIGKMQVRGRPRNKQDKIIKSVFNTLKKCK